MNAVIVKSNAEAKHDGKELTAKVAVIVNHLNDGIHSWKAAGRLLVELLDAGVTVEELVAVQPDVLSEGLVEMFERIGRDQLLPQVAVAPWPAAKALGYFPADRQGYFLEHTVQLLIMKEGDKTDVLQMNVRHLTAAQSAQVFNRGAVRSLSEQRAWLAERMQNQVMSESREKGKKESGWMIRKGRLVVLRPGVEFTHGEMVRILAQMTGG